MLKVTKTVTGSEPITLDEAKSWMRVDDTNDDTLITALITQTRELVEEYLNTSIVQTTLVLDATARKELLLPYGPVVTITTVQDQEGEDVDYTYNGFYIDFGDVGTISVTGGDTTYVDTVTTYDAGVSTIPSGLKLGMLEVIAWLYENRGDDTGFMMMLERNTNLAPYRQKIWV